MKVYWRLFRQKGNIEMDLKEITCGKIYEDDMENGWLRSWQDNIDMDLKEMTWYEYVFIQTTWKNTRGFADGRKILRWILKK